MVLRNGCLSSRVGDCRGENFCHGCPIRNVKVPLYHLSKGSRQGITGVARAVRLNASV